MAKPRRNCCKLQLKVPEEDEVEIEEVTARLVVFSVHAAVATVLSQPNHVFTLKEEQRTALKAVLLGNMFLLYP